MNINGRIKALENRVPQNQDDLGAYHHAQEIYAYHVWVDGFLTAFQEGQVNPKPTGGGRWYIAGDYACNLVMLINKKFNLNIPDYFEVVAECQRVIDWLHNEALAIKKILDNELSKVMPE